MPDDIVFQVLNWVAVDVAAGELSDDEEEDATNDEAFYHIKMFGVDARGKSVSVTVASFEPHFYIKLKTRLSIRQVDAFVETVKKRLPYVGSIDATLIAKKDFWGFTNGKVFPFLRLTFKSEKSMKSVARLLTSPKPFLVPGVAQRVYPLYESNISPMLRFAHIRDIPSVGWIRITNYRKATVLESRCNIDIQTHWKNVHPYDGKEDIIAPFLIASFDIECMSSDGDFPVARKTYKKIANDVYNILNNDKSPAATKQIADLITHLFIDGKIIPFKPVVMDEIKSNVFQCSDHMRVVVAGDLGMLRSALKEKIASIFNKGGFETYDRFMIFYDKIQPTTKSSGMLRRCLQTWLQKCLVQQNANMVWEYRSRHDELIEDMLSYIMKDKDAIVAVLSKYLEKILPPIRGDEIIQIGTTYHRYGDNDVSKRVILSLGKCAAVPDAEVIECETELEMLQSWVNLISRTDPDVITGYNIFGFDFAYMYERALELGCKTAFDDTGRLTEYAAEYKESRLSSSALGDNVMRYIDMHGRTSIDMMKVIQRDHKLDSYKLDTVASHFMNLNKMDVSPQQIFDLYRTGVPENIARIADYCVQDCALCNKLIMKLETIASNIGMANVCSVPLSYIFMRGQGVKIFSLVAKECKRRGYLVPTQLKTELDEEHEEGYEGAIVLEPKTGIYIDTPIAVLDYASLYPSSMISENLSHDCMVLDAAYDNLDGVTYLDVAYDLYDNNDQGDKVKVGEKVCRYAQPAEGEKGIIPNILMHLLKQRKHTRKRMELKTLTCADGVMRQGIMKGNDIVSLTGEITSGQTITDSKDLYSPFQKATLDGLQNAYKVTANSLYGQIGAKTSPIYLKDIAACTTATGRKMILLAKDYLEQNYNADIVYGDSVTGDTPLIVKYANNQIDVVCIRDLPSSTWIPYKVLAKEGTEKQQAFVVAQVWSNGNWSKVNRVIRHKTRKQLYRVGTTFGAVDVTVDHSLIEKDTMAHVSPVQIEIYKTAIAGELPPVAFFDSIVCYDHVEDFGRRMRDFPEDLQGTDAIFHRLRQLLNANAVTRANFVIGLLDKDVQITLPANARLAQYICTLIQSVNPDKKIIVYRSNIDASFVLTKSNNLRGDTNVVQSVTPLNDVSDPFVYDIETEEGMFHGGVGEMLLKNTDSLFVHFPETQNADQKVALANTIATGKRASEGIKPLLKLPHDLEYEKTFWPFILFSKKRYVANQYGNDPHNFKQTSMGIVLKRRDNANIVKHVYGGIIDIILNKHDVHESVMFLKDSLDALLRGAFPMDDLIISKTLRAHYKDPSRIAHRVLADRIKDRCPGNAPQANDRIPYIYVVNHSSKKLLQSDRIEHPDFIRENGLVPDYEFYISNQIMNPILQLFAIVLEQLAGYTRDAGYWKDVEKQMVREGKSRQQIKERLASMREMEVKQLLFDPVFKRLASDPTNIMLKNKQKGNRTITEWFKAA